MKKEDKMKVKSELLKEHWKLFDEILEQMNYHDLVRVICMASNKIHHTQCEDAKRKEKKA